MIDRVVCVNRSREDDGMAEDVNVRLKHLDAIQGVISRLSQNSFTIRGWSVTLVSVVFAILSTNDTAPGLVLVTLLPALIFWWLDAYYLRQERLFRRLYAAVARTHGAHPAPDGPAAFDMDPSPYRKEAGFLSTLLAPNVLAIPMTLSAVIIAYGVSTL
jgi:hypothetical protein